MKNKYAFFLLITLVLFLGISGCDWGWQRYTNDEYGFSILLPGNWEKLEGLYNTVLLAKAPFTDKTDRFQENINVVVTQLPQQIELSTFFEMNKDELMRSLGSATEISEGDIFAGFFPGKWLSFEGMMKELKLKVMLAVWMKGGRVYAITCASQANEFKKYEPLFYKILRSLRAK